MKSKILACHEQIAPNELRRREMLFALCGLAPGAYAQTAITKSTATLAPVGPGRVPSQLERYLKAAGTRLTTAGKERMIQTGQIQIGNGAKAPLAWSREYPGKLKLDGAGKNLVFDLEKSNRAQLDDLDEDILEGLTNDTDEAFFEQMQNGNQGRFIGANFKMLGLTGFCSTVDVFEMAMPVAARKTKGSSVKHFMFDNSTGYLHKVAYFKPTGGKGTPILMELSNYEVIDGSAVARRLVRTVNKTSRFRIESDRISFAPQAKDDVFATAK